MDVQQLSANNCHVFGLVWKCVKVQVTTTSATGIEELNGIIQDYKRVLNSVVVWYERDTQQRLEQKNNLKHQQ